MDCDLVLWGAVGCSVSAAAFTSIIGGYRAELPSAVTAVPLYHSLNSQHCACSNAGPAWWKWEQLAGVGCTTGLLSKYFCLCCDSGANKLEADAEFAFRALVTCILHALLSCLVVVCPLASIDLDAQFSRAY